MRKVKTKVGKDLCVFCDSDTATAIQVARRQFNPEFEGILRMSIAELDECGDDDCGDDDEED